EDSLRAVWDVDVDEVLGVECVDLALAGSHDGWGEDGEEPSPRVREDKHRPLKCRCQATGRYLEARGVRLVLTEAMHADAAPGAGESERLRQRGPSCAVHCRPI
ncbi:hypothetical protein POSPLADRAFT_1154347, partial [Postia placenta MAD-698-R-SB12]